MAWCLCAAFVAAMVSSGALAQAAGEPVVEFEATVATYVPPNNGAGPLWCFGAPLVTRFGDEAYVSAMETGEGIEPLCNTRWVLYRVAGRTVDLLQHEDAYVEREPCPLVRAGDSLYLSVNPLRSVEGPRQGPCDPHLLRFALPGAAEAPSPVKPPWPDGATLTEHSYRGLAADGPAGEVLALTIDAATSQQHWCLLSRDGNSAAHGSLSFPIRACYPQVALRGRAAHVLAIGDIVEPVAEWRTYKHEQTQREWDYVFRRLFYAWSPDLTAAGFAEPLEVENLEATAGYISNYDLWIGPDGEAHLLYAMTPVQSPLMRDRFFTDVKLVTSLVHTVLRDGAVVSREVIAEGGEGLPQPALSWARFHATGDGRLFIVYYGSGANWLMRLLPDRGEPARLPLNHPITQPFTNTERGGSEPSRTLDLFGTTDEPNTLGYARIRLP